MKLSDAARLLRESGISDPRDEARRLFSQVGGIPTEKLVGFDYDCDDPSLVEAVKRRAERYPLQYIVGEVDFYREKYSVSENCLIPRSDTEVLVDYAVKHLPSGAMFADLCTGSGCVALSTLNNTENTSAIAVDISASALEIARKNAVDLNLCHRVEFLQCDVLDKAVCDRIYALLSNPPYITEDAYRALEPEVYREPRIALVGGDDGLDFYKRLIPLYRDKLLDGGFMAFEIGYDQGNALCLIAEENTMTCEIIKDFCGNDRVAVLKKK